MVDVLNPHNLPAAYVAAVSQRRVPQEKTISATELLSPPQQRALWLDHHEEIPLVAGVDDHDLFHGNAVHAYLERFAGATAIAEERMAYQIDGWKITGTPDSIEWLGLQDTLLIDWKTTKVRALQYDKQEWEQQANLYVHLARLNGVEIHGIQLWIFLKDWDRQMLHNPEYPRAHLCRIDVPVWPVVRAHDFLMTRLRLHQAAQEGAYAHCSDDERWVRTSWAVQKITNSRATKAGFKTKDEAREYAAALIEPPRHWADWYELRADVSEPLRCQSWCPVSQFCEQRQAELADAEAVRA